MMKQELLAVHRLFPQLVVASGEKAATRFIDFFTSNIRNTNTRKAYAKDVGNFLA